MTTLMVESVLRSLVLAAMVWTGLKLLRVRHVLAQKIAWGLVLLVAFAMPMLMRWQVRHPRTALVVPVKRTATVSALSNRVTSLERHVFHPAPVRASSGISLSSFAADAPVISLSQPAGSAPRRWHVADLVRYIVPAYLAVCAILLLRLLVGLAMAMRIWNNAELASPILEPRATVRISEDIQSPVTIGSGIVLPANYVAWDRSKLRLVLAHERAHVRQGDFYLQLLASVYAALVWISPLGWWLKHRLADLGEALSDHAALLEAEDNSSYAEVLLEFAAMPRPGFVGVAAGVGMARSSNIQSRIERILNDRIFRSAFLYGRRHAVIAALLVPAGLVLATSLLHVQAAERVKTHAINAWLSTQRIQAKSAVAAVALTGASSKTTLAALARTQLSEVRALIRDVQAAPEAPAPPPAAPAPDVVPAVARTIPASASVSAVHAPAPFVLTAPNGAAMVAQQESEDEVDSVQDDDDDNDSFAIVDHDKGSSFTFNGSGEFAGKLDSLRNKISGSFIWFERDDKSYVITDPALVARAKALFAPQSELGRRQAELGRQQAELGRQQAELGRQQEMVKVQMPDISKQMEELQQSLKEISQLKSQEVSQEKLSEIQSRLGALQGQLASAQSQAGSRMGAFGEQQGELGRRQGELGRQQGELGREQGRIAREASQRVKSMIDQAYRDGKAKPVD